MELKAEELRCKKLENELREIELFKTKNETLKELFKDGIINQHHFEMLIKGIPFMKIENGQISIGETIYFISPSSSSPTSLKYPPNRYAFSIPRLHQNEEVWIKDFLIHPCYRKIGLAKMLMNLVSNYSRYLGKKQLRIFKTAYPQLNGFLGHYGFTECKPPVNCPVYEMTLSLKPESNSVRTKNKNAQAHGV